MEIARCRNIFSWQINPTTAVLLHIHSYTGVLQGRRRLRLWWRLSIRTASEATAVSATTWEEDDYDKSNSKAASDGGRVEHAGRVMVLLVQLGHTSIFIRTYLQIDLRLFELCHSDCFNPIDYQTTFTHTRPWIWGCKTLTTGLSSEQGHVLVVAKSTIRSLFYRHTESAKL